MFLIDINNKVVKCSRISGVTSLNSQLQTIKHIVSEHTKPSIVTNRSVIDYNFKLLFCILSICSHVK